ncbi:MAG: hypothetical protein AB7E32_17400, partial [Desulfovibrio sp.]
MQEFAVVFDLVPTFSLLGTDYHLHLHGNGEQASADAPALAELSLRVRPLHRNSDPLSYLSCHAEASRFAGRHDIIETLLAWAHEDGVPLVRFVTGPGGAGKTRLAAHFGELLVKQGWAAGFISLSPQQQRTLPKKFRLGERGTLLLVDYPEANLERVHLLLKELAELDARAPRIRLLLLTRSTLGEWLERLDCCGASNL